MTSPTRKRAPKFIPLEGARRKMVMGTWNNPTEHVCIPLKRGKCDVWECSCGLFYEDQGSLSAPKRIVRLRFERLWVDPDSPTPSIEPDFTMPPNKWEPHVQEYPGVVNVTEWGSDAWWHREIAEAERVAREMSAMPIVSRGKVEDGKDKKVRWKNPFTT